MKNFEHFKELRDKLSTPIIIFPDSGHLSRIDEMARAIEARSDGRRPYNRIYRDTFIGCIRELAVVRLLDGGFNPKKFDVTDRDSYAWDVDAKIGGDRVKFEVKPTPDTGEYFSFSESIKKVLQNNEGHFDFIVTVSVFDKDEVYPSDGYTCIPRLLIPSAVFYDNIKKSQFGKAGKAYYFNHNAVPWTVIRGDSFGKRIGTGAETMHRTPTQEVTGLSES